MFQPELDKILEKVDCRYTLVVEVAKRARQIIDGAQQLVDDQTILHRHGNIEIVRKIIRDLYHRKRRAMILHTRDWRIGIIVI